MLHNKYKPTKFSDMIGNKIIFDKLQEYIDTNSIPNCLLLSGQRGTGKSSSADILANSIPNSYIEIIDGAVSSGVEVSRDLVSTITSMPLGYKNRIVILEEVHNVSKKFLEALLVVTNDPPKNVYFIALTTEFNKVISTFKSRFIKFDFKIPSLKERIDFIDHICEMERVKLDESVIDRICAKYTTPRDILTGIDPILRLSTEEQLILLDEDVESAKGYEIAKLLGKNTWNRVKALLKDVDNSEVEGIRRTVLAYHTTSLLGGNENSALVLDSFTKEMYDVPKASLVLACYENCK